MFISRTDQADKTLYPLNFSPLKSLAFGAILICCVSTANAQHGPNALQSGAYDWCGNYSHPWRVTVCECSGSTDGRLYGDGIYKMGSNPCKAAAHSGLLDIDGNGTIAVEPHADLSAFPASERNGIRSREARGGPAFVIRPVRTEQDVERERHRSAEEIPRPTNIAELAGFWKAGNLKYYFTGSELINLQKVDGVRAFRHPRASTATWRVFPPGTVLMKVTSGTEEHFVGYWLFEDRFWGRVEGEMISPSRFIDIDEVSEDGRMRRGAISLHRDDSLTVDEAMNQYPLAFANAHIVSPLAASNSLNRADATRSSSPTIVQSYEELPTLPWSSAVTTDEFLDAGEYSELLNTAYGVAVETEIWVHELAGTVPFGSVVYQIGKYAGFQTIAAFTQSEYATQRANEEFLGIGNAIINHDIEAISEMVAGRAYAVFIGQLLSPRIAE